jgi:hypothetical protein
MQTKFIEGNVPDHLRVHVVYLHEGRTSRNQLKKIGQTNTRYVTLARLKDQDDNVVGEGIAACSQGDNPSRKVGRAVAVGRALQEYYA